MEVGSVNSGNALAIANRQATESRQAAEAQKVQQAERREEKLDEPVEPKAEAPKPVVNAQGQQTGTKVNVTA